jgi:hypothetical protein
MCKVKDDKSAVIFTRLHPNLQGMPTNPTVLKSRPVTVHGQLCCTGSNAHGALSSTRQLRFWHAQQKMADKGKSQLRRRTVHIQYASIPYIKQL